MSRELYNLYANTANEESLHTLFTGVDRRSAFKRIHDSVRYHIVLFAMLQETPIIY